MWQFHKIIRDGGSFSVYFSIFRISVVAARAPAIAPKFQTTRKKEWWVCNRWPGPRSLSFFVRGFPKTSPTDSLVPAQPELSPMAAPGLRGTGEIGHFTESTVTLQETRNLFLGKKAHGLERGKWKSLQRVQVQRLRREGLEAAIKVRRDHRAWARAVTIAMPDN